MAWRGINGGELGRLTGTSPQRVWAWRHGEEPRLMLMNRVADLLGVSRWWLLTGEAGAGRVSRCPACGKRL